MDEEKRQPGLEGRLHPIGIFIGEGEIALFEIERLLKLGQEYTQWTHLCTKDRRLERIEEWDVVYTNADVRGRVRASSTWYEITAETNVARKERCLLAHPSKEGQP